MWFMSWQMQEIFLFSKMSRLAPGATVSYSLCMRVFPMIKVAIGKVDHFPPNRAKVKYEWCYNSILPACLHGTDKKSFTYFTFTLLTLCMHRHNIAVMQMMYIQNICDSNLSELQFLSYFLSPSLLKVRV